MESLARVAADSFAEARKSAGILIFAYVLMHDHYHILTNNARSIKEVLRFLNGISARRIINHLNEQQHTESLRKLRIAEQRDG